MIFVHSIQNYSQDVILLSWQKKSDFQEFFSQQPLYIIK